MAEGSEDDDVGQGTSPWATDVPITPAPVEFTWATAESVSPAAGANDDPGSTAGPTSHSSTSDDAPVAVGGRRSGLIAVAALAAIAGIVGVLTLAGGGSDGSADVVDSIVPPTEPIVDSLPPIATEPPVDEADEASPTTERVEPTLGSTEQTTVKLTEGEWSSFTIDVPEVLQSLRPTVVAGVTEQGGYHEIELPAGRVRSIGIDRSAVSAQLVVGESSSLLAGFAVSRSNSLLLRPGEPPIETDLPGNRNDVVAVPSTDDYVMISYQGGSASFTEVRLAGDGTTTESAVEIGPIAPWLSSFSPSGKKLVTDAGGIYERLPDGGATRISNGVLVAATSHHLLVRECDETYTCEFVLIDDATGQRRVVQLDDAFNPQFAGSTVHVSPDGAFVRYVSFGPDGATEALVELQTGERMDIGVGGEVESSRAVWPAGSEGVFRRAAGAPGLELIDRETGVATRFAGVLGSFTQFGTRLGVELPERLEPSALATGVELIGLSAAGDIVRIEVDTGAVITTGAPPLASGAPARVVPDADGALIVSYDNVPSIRFDARDDVASIAPSSRPGGPLFDGPVPGSLWEGRAGQAMVLVDALGRELGPRVERADRTSVIAGDGAGGVMFAADLGGVFVAGADSSPTRLTSGEILAINADVAYARECDDDFVCGVFRIDRRTSERAPVEGGLLDRAVGMPSSIVWSGSSVSPDGEVAIVFTSDGATSSGGALVADLANDSSTTTASLELSTPIIWSGDSRFAVFLVDDALRVYDRAAAQMQTLPSIPELKAIALVPDDVADIAAPVFEIRPDLSTGIDGRDARTSAPTAPDVVAAIEVTGAAEFQRLVVGPARFPF